VQLPDGRRRYLTTIAGALLAVLMSMPALADANAGPLDPQFKNERTYFHCGSPSKLGNVNFVVDGSIPGWDTTRPASSVSDGSGCGTGDLRRPGAVVDPQENPTDGVWRGTFTGNLDRLTVHVHCICLGSSRANNVASIGVRLKIDGEAITGDGTASHNLTAVPENLGATQLYEFSVTGIEMLEPNVDEDDDGIGDNPFGKVQHEITLTLEGHDVVTNPFGVWAYDTREVPSGITFNPSSLAATRIPRT